jgi:hypothetical protein
MRVPATGRSRHRSGHRAAGGAPGGRGPDYLLENPDATTLLSSTRAWGAIPSADSVVTHWYTRCLCYCQRSLIGQYGACQAIARDAFLPVDPQSIPLFSIPLMASPAIGRLAADTLAVPPGTLASQVTPPAMSLPLASQVTHEPLGVFPPGNVASQVSPPGIALDEPLGGFHGTIAGHSPWHPGIAGQGSLFTMVDVQNRPIRTLATV